jgi:hypothetical protein
MDGRLISAVGPVRPHPTHSAKGGRLSLFLAVAYLLGMLCLTARIGYVNLTCGHILGWQPTQSQVTAAIKAYPGCSALIRQSYQDSRRNR